MTESQADHIVFFDGVCSLCNGYVRFLMKRDTEGKYYVAPLDGDTATELLPERFLTEDVDSIVYMDRSGNTPEYYSRSTAVIEILTGLGGVWRLVAVLRIIPAFVRDAVYDFVANNRYDWFGKHDTCPAPEPGWKDRFLE
jgi:predicted DCC family thiol-disulfide oxidoreductase YuxK